MAHHTPPSKQVAKPRKRKSVKGSKANKAENNCKALVLHDPSSKQVAIPRRKKRPIDDEVQIIDTRSSKRIASLNASAILAASYLSESTTVKRSRSLESTRSTRSTGSALEVVAETKIKPKMSKAELSSSSKTNNTKKKPVNKSKDKAGSKCKALVKQTSKSSSKKVAKPGKKKPVKGRKTKAENNCKALVLHDPSSKQVAIPRKRRLVDDEVEIIDTRSCKRMASLNASAILAASYLPERIFKRSRSIESTRSTGSTVEMIHETKISSSISRVELPSSSTMHACKTNEVLIESAKTIEMIKKVRRKASGKIRDRLLATEMMERENDMIGKDLAESGLINNGSKISNRSMEKVTSKSVKKCRRVGNHSIQSTKATTGLRTTEYQATKVHINTSKAGTHVDREKTAHQIETILEEDAIVRKYRIQQTKATSQSYRVQMETSSFTQPSPGNIFTSNTVPCLPLHSSQGGGDQHVNLTNGPSTLQNGPMLSNQGFNHTACFSYPNQSVLQVSYNQPYRALTSSSSTINQINQIPVLNIGTQYPLHYGSAFSLPHHSNQSASINYPSESYGLYQPNGPIIQPLHDSYIRAYPVHKPIPYHASQMVHHSGSNYRDFNSVKPTNYQQQHPQHTQLTHQKQLQPPPQARQPIQQMQPPPPPPPMASHIPSHLARPSSSIPQHQLLPPPPPPPPPPSASENANLSTPRPRIESNNYQNKSLSYEPSYYILQYPNNDLSCSLRTNNVYHNPSQNDQIIIPSDLSVNIAVNQTVPNNSSGSNGTSSPSIAFLGSTTSIVPGRIIPSMFQSLQPGNSELPQGLSPVPGPAPVAVATPVSVDNYTTMSANTQSNGTNEIASLSPTGSLLASTHHSSITSTLVDRQPTNRLCCSDPCSTTTGPGERRTPTTTNCPSQPNITSNSNSSTSCVTNSNSDNATSNVKQKVAAQTPSNILKETAVAVSGKDSPNGTATKKTNRKDNVTTNNKKVQPSRNNKCPIPSPAPVTNPNPSQKKLTNAHSVPTTNNAPSTKQRVSKTNKNSEAGVIPAVPNASPETSTVVARKNGKKRLFHGWSWRGHPVKKLVFIKADEPPQPRYCYPAICHSQGDIIRVRDCVLLRGGPRKTGLHFVAKICALWEAQETGEMMMSLLWYYRPEHTEPGRKPNQMPDEIFASKHQDVNSVACIDDKCYVLTYNEYCRYRKRQKMQAEDVPLSLTDKVIPCHKESYDRKNRLPKKQVFPDRVFLCRKVYNFRLGRILKNPVSPVTGDDAAWKR